MRKILLVGLLVAVLAIAGCAKEAEARGGPPRDICDTPLGDIFNKCHIVTHPKTVIPSVDKELMPVGVGLDFILYESDVKDIYYKVTLEYKYDVRNSEQSAYGVLTLRLMDIINKIKGE